MPVNKFRFLVVAGSVVITSAGAAAYALPGPTACLTIAALDLQSASDNVLTNSVFSVDRQRFKQLTHDARSRISATYGIPESKPNIVFFTSDKGLGPFTLNRYGSTNFIGRRACIFIGPNGQNVDVVAHELMHAELHHRVGAVKRFLEIPTWFDEGVAMQVDHRKEYDLRKDNAGRIDAVRKLDSSSKFYVPDDRTLTRNYAMSKAVVDAWLADIGTSALYDRLNRIKAGETFADAIKQ